MIQIIKSEFPQKMKVRSDEDTQKPRYLSYVKIFYRVIYVHVNYETV